MPHLIRDARSFARLMIYPKASVVISIVVIVIISIVMHTVILGAEVIHSVAFEDDLHALDLHTAEDGHAVLNEIPYLQVSCSLCYRCKPGQAQHFLYVHVTQLLSMCIEKHHASYHTERDYIPCVLCKMPLTAVLSACPCCTGHTQKSQQRQKRAPMQKWMLADCTTIERIRHSPATLAFA